jgi:hypothetical protein
VTQPVDPSRPFSDTPAIPSGLEPRTRGGRPSRLTQEVADRIVEAVEQGSYIKIAAQAAGVGQSTLAGWLARGREAASARDRGEDMPDDEAPYLELLESVTRAQALAETSAVAAWRSAFTGPEADWRAARDYLARTAPERWAGVTRVQMTTEEAERRIDDAVNEALLSVGIDMPGADPIDDPLDDGLDDELDP